MHDRAAHMAAVAALAEPTRRRLYDHVVRQAGPVSRDEAAAATDVPRATVAFHLDKLVDEGLLDVMFERRTGRSGPGAAGRPSCTDERSATSPCPCPNAGTTWPAVCWPPPWRKRRRPVNPRGRCSPGGHSIGDVHSA